MKVGLTEEAGHDALLQGANEAQCGGTKGVEGITMADVPSVPENGVRGV